MSVVGVDNALSSELTSSRVMLRLERLEADVSLPICRGVDGADGSTDGPTDATSLFWFSTVFLALGSPVGAKNPFVGFVAAVLFAPVCLTTATLLSLLATPLPPETSGAA